jgi:hypothetical protein
MFKSVEPLFTSSARRSLGTDQLAGSRATGSDPKDVNIYLHIHMMYGRTQDAKKNDKIRDFFVRSYMRWPASVFSGGDAISDTI